MESWLFLGEQAEEGFDFQWNTAAAQPSILHDVTVTAGVTTLVSDSIVSETNTHIYLNQLEPK